MADTPVSPTNVTALPTAPNRNTQTNPLTYSQTADAWAGALPTWTTQVNNIAANVNFNADSAFDSAAEALASKNAAEAAEAAAIAATNATQWVSGQAYDAGDVVYSPINFLSYRANTNTSGTTDPSLSANWTPLNEVDLSTDAVGTLPVANGGTGATTLAGANIPVTTAANTFTNTQTFSGSTSALGIVLSDAAEVATVSATAATGTINYDITTQSVLYYTSNASANWTVNFRASSGTSLNTALATGQSVTAAFLVTQGATAYYNSAVQVDGSSVTPKWQGGTAPAAGNASGIDAYIYTIIKTGAATFTVLASQTRFA